MDKRKRTMVFFADDPIGTIWKVAVTFAAIAAVGVPVPPGLQTNAFTLADHQGQERTKPPLTREEAVAVGHRSVEIDRWFGLAPGLAENETGKPAG